MNIEESEETGAESRRIEMMILVPPSSQKSGSDSAEIPVHSEGSRAQIRGGRGTLTDEGNQIFTAYVITNEPMSIVLPTCLFNY